MHAKWVHETAVCTHTYITQYSYWWSCHIARVWLRATEMVASTSISRCGLEKTSFSLPVFLKHGCCFWLLFVAAVFYCHMYAVVDWNMQLLCCLLARLRSWRSPSTKLVLRWKDAWFLWTRTETCLWHKFVCMAQHARPSSSVSFHCVAL